MPPAELIDPRAAAGLAGARHTVVTTAPAAPRAAGAAAVVVHVESLDDLLPAPADAGRCDRRPRAVVGLAEARRMFVTSADPRGAKG